MLRDSFGPSFTPNGPSRVDFGPIYDFGIFRKPKLDQGLGSAWTRDGAHPGPGMELILDQGRGSAWTIGLSLDQGRGSAWASISVWGPFGSHFGTHFE